MKIRCSTEHGLTRGDFLKMSGAGRLFLRINDDTPANGSFTAHIQVFRH